MSPEAIPGMPYVDGPLALYAGFAAGNLTGVIPQLDDLNVAQIDALFTLQLKEGPLSGVEAALVNALLPIKHALAAPSPERIAELANLHGIMMGHGDFDRWIVQLGGAYSPDQMLAAMQYQFSHLKGMVVAQQIEVELENVHLDKVEKDIKVERFIACVTMMKRLITQSISRKKNKERTEAEQFVLDAFEAQTEEFIEEIQAQQDKMAAVRAGLTEDEKNEGLYTHLVRLSNLARLEQEEAAQKFDAHISMISHDFATGVLSIFGEEAFPDGFRENGGLKKLEADISGLLEQLAIDYKAAMIDAEEKHAERAQFFEKMKAEAWATPIGDEAIEVWAYKNPKDPKRPVMLKEKAQDARVSAHIIEITRGADAPRRVKDLLSMVESDFDQSKKLLLDILNKVQQHYPNAKKITDKTFVDPDALLEHLGKFELLINGALKEAHAANKNEALVHTYAAAQKKGAVTKDSLLAAASPEHKAAVEIFLMRDTYKSQARKDVSSLPEGRQAAQKAKDEKSIEAQIRTLAAADQYQAIKEMNGTGLTTHQLFDLVEKNPSKACELIPAILVWAQVFDPKTGMKYVPGKSDTAEDLFELLCEQEKEVKKHLRRLHFAKPGADQVNAALESYSGLQKAVSERRYTFSELKQAVLGHEDPGKALRPILSTPSELKKGFDEVIEGNNKNYVNEVSAMLSDEVDKLKPLTTEKELFSFLCDSEILTFTDKYRLDDVTGKYTIYMAGGAENIQGKKEVDFSTVRDEYIEQLKADLNRIKAETRQDQPKKISSLKSRFKEKFRLDIEQKTQEHRNNRNDQLKKWMTDNEALITTHLRECQKSDSAEITKLSDTFSEAKVHQEKRDNHHRLLMENEAERTEQRPKLKLSLKGVVVTDTFKKKFKSVLKDNLKSGCTEEDLEAGLASAISKGGNTDSIRRPEVTVLLEQVREGAGLETILKRKVSLQAANIGRPPTSKNKPVSDQILSMIAGSSAPDFAEAKSGLALLQPEKYYDAIFSPQTEEIAVMLEKLHSKKIPYDANFTEWRKKIDVSALDALTASGEPHPNPELQNTLNSYITLQHALLGAHYEDEPTPAEINGIFVREALRKCYADFHFGEQVPPEMTDAQKVKETTRLFASQYRWEPDHDDAHQAVELELAKFGAQYSKGEIDWQEYEEALLRVTSNKQNIPEEAMAFLEYRCRLDIAYQKCINEGFSPESKTRLDAQKSLLVTDKRINSEMKGVLEHVNAIHSVMRIHLAEMKAQETIDPLLSAITTRPPRAFNTRQLSKATEHITRMSRHNDEIAALKQVIDSPQLNTRRVRVVTQTRKTIRKTAEGALEHLMEVQTKGANRMRLEQQAETHHSAHNIRTNKIQPRPPRLSERAHRVTDETQKRPRKKEGPTPFSRTRL